MNYNELYTIKKKVCQGNEYNLNWEVKTDK